MPIATGLALGIGAGVSAAAGLGSAALSSNAASNAASAQTNAANHAADLQHQDAEQALQFQEQQFNTQQQNLSPWLNSGQGALTNLNYLLGIGQNPFANGGTGASTTPNPALNAPSVSGTASLPGGATQVGPARPTAPVQTGVGDGIARPGAPVQPAASRVQGGISAAPGSPAMPGAPVAAGSNYAGQSFNQLTNSGDPNVSPNQQTTQQWKAEGIPFQNITTSDGRTVSVKTGTSPTSGAPAPNPNANPALTSTINPALGGFGSLSQGFNQTFQAPNAITEQNDPGYQSRLAEGQKALDRSAAAKGDLLSGGTAKAEQQFGQDYASNEYGNVYNRALTGFNQNYNIFENNQNNEYNRLASLAGLGQTTASQLNSSGQTAANNISSTLLTSGAQQGQQLNNAGAATASGYVGGTIPYSGAINNLGSLGQLATLSQILNQPQPGGGGGGYSTNPGSQTSS